MRLNFACLIFVARDEYENILTAKISRFTVFLVLTQGYFPQVSSSKRLGLGCIHFNSPIKAVFSIDITVSKHAAILPCLSAKTRLLSTCRASLWQLLSRCSLRLCRVRVLRKMSIHSALPDGARTGLQLVLQQTLHNIPCSS